MKRLPVLLILCLAGCGPTLTPVQQAALVNLEVIGARAACAKMEVQYLKVKNPTPTQAAAVDYARAACANPVATVAAVTEAAKSVIALIPPKA
jgi:hypothetical protein